MASFRNGYGLIVGISNYRYVNRLPATVLKDARDVFTLLCSPVHASYLDSNLRLLLDEHATKQDILGGLNWLANVAGSNDTVILFFSGHGARSNEESSPRNYLLPYECDLTNLEGTAIDSATLTTILSQIKAPRVLVFFDCCHSGGIGEPKNALLGRPLIKSGLDEEYYQQLAVGSGRVIMSSSRSDEVSWILPGMDNSVFTHYLLEALSGAAPTKSDGFVRVFDVFDYISSNVPQRARQHPVFKAHDLEDNYPIALYMGGKQISTTMSQLDNDSPAFDKIILRKILVSLFSIEELEELCADIEQKLLNAGQNIQVSLELVGGNNKTAKVINLIGYLERRRVLEYLLASVRQHRPGAI